VTIQGYLRFLTLAWISALSALSQERGRCWDVVKDERVLWAAFPNAPGEPDGTGTDWGMVSASRLQTALKWLRLQVPISVCLDKRPNSSAAYRETSPRPGAPVSVISALTVTISIVGDGTLLARRSWKAGLPPSVVVHRDPPATISPFANEDSLLADLWGQKASVEWLVKNGADVNGKDEFGDTPLHWASMSDHTDGVKLLLANGANVNAKDNYGTTPLYNAAAACQKATTELLVVNGADVNASRAVSSVTASGLEKGQATPLRRAEYSAQTDDRRMRSRCQDVVALLRKHGG
jgi:hypothetical protein